MTIIF